MNTWADFGPRATSRSPAAPTPSPASLPRLHSGSSGTYSLNGGILILPALDIGYGTAAFNFGGGTLQASGSFTTTLPMTLTGSGGNATVDTAGYTVTLSGSLSGPGGLTKTDSGTLVLATTNTYTGDTLISGGTLQLTDAHALQNSTLNISGSGSLNFSGLTAATLGGLKGSGNLSLANTANAGVALTAGGNNYSTSYSGALSGSGSFTKTGTGTLVLAGSNSYSGGTTVSGGILQFNGNTTVPGSGTVTINSGAALALAPTGTYSTVAGWLNSGKITAASAGALALIAASDTETISMSGYPNLSLGASGNATFSGAFTPSGTTYRLGGGGGRLTFSPAITGATSLNVSGRGAVVLTGSNKYTGGTTVSGGTLDFAGPKATPSTGILTINSGGYVVLAPSWGVRRPRPPKAIPIRLRSTLHRALRRCARHVQRHER